MGAMEGGFTYQQHQNKKSDVCGAVWCGVVWCGDFIVHTTRKNNNSNLKSVEDVSLS
jgi:hypothetical protein